MVSVELTSESKSSVSLSGAAKNGHSFWLICNNFFFLQDDCGVLAGNLPGYPLSYTLGMIDVVY